MSYENPLAQFSQGRKLADYNLTTKKPYQAYDKKGKLCPSMEILCLTQPSRSPQSRFFLSTVFSADSEDILILLYSFMAVEIKGRYLKEVRQAIQNNRCDFIQEYNENEFAAPNQKDPVIYSIQFRNGDKLDEVLTKEKENV